MTVMDSSQKKKLSEQYAKRTKAVLKEFQKKFRPKSFKERIGYNLMLNSVIEQIYDEIKAKDPEEIKEMIETLAKRLMWIIQ